MGGKALKNVVRIRKEEMLPTLQILQEHLYQVLGLTLQNKDYCTCGSFLVRESCGDIDIAFDINKAMENLRMTRDEITERLNKLYVNLPEYNYSKGLDIHSIPFPIFDKDGKRTDKYVQVDLMPVENVGMAHWGMFTDGNTPWKSATRNGLLRAIAKFRDTVVHTNEDGTILSFDRYYFDQRHGLFRMVRSYEGKDGRINKTPKTIEKKLVTNDPEEILFILLDVIDVRHSFRNVMDVWSLISDPEHPLFDRIEFIVKEYIDEMNRDGFDYPSEIKEWWDEQLEDDCK